jgi:hypothetical protein
MTKKDAGTACFFFTGSLPNALSLILSKEQTLLTRGSVQAATRTTSDWSTSFRSMSSESRYKICKKIKNRLVTKIVRGEGAEEERISGAYGEE